MIGFRSLALRRGGRLLLSGLDFTLHAGWRVGLVGRNGCGKSSLLAAILGELESDEGQIDLPNRVRIASVAQETPALKEAALRYVIGGDAELAAALAREVQALAMDDHAAAAAAHHDIELLNGYDAEARAGRLLHGLGFASSVFEQPVASFSGGWRVRLNLARALMAPSDLLLLDEPTNHLDLDAVLWLEQWLQRYTGTVIVISHDREFLDEVCTHVVHLHEGRGRLYNGNYTGFERQRAEQLRQQQIAFEKEQTERAHLQSFINRFKAKASKAKQAQSRVKRLEKLAGTEAVRAESPFRFSFETAAELPSPLLRLSQLSAGYQVGGERIEVLSGVKFSLEPGDRVALLGANGAGKSTLVKTLVGEIEPLAGERVLHPAARIGYFAQHTVESLREHETPIQHLARLADKQPEQVLRDWLGRWNFPGDRAFDPVEGFSGGERARLALALIAWRRPNVLLLDEPTNHLDMDMREALAEALALFDGALVLVSHDRHLIGLACDRFWRVAEGTVAPFDGDLDDYAAWLRSRDRDPQRSDPDNAKVVSADNAKQRRRSAAEQRDKERPLKNRLKQLETAMAQQQQALAELEQQLAAPELYQQDGRAAGELSRKQAELHAAHAQNEAAWLETYEALEALAET
ncbi:ABC-F family ATP-binding cassette domain-containing protein [Pseudomarimonas arenosa]|uniref:Probable ATP-binding protein YheS n=1 Tax=Pseudomarimonas arenosa TaxID=2774145 RepID=A0AAW3ZGS6_9GAMM|nr:ATP-binding cassette domain-containing protein [Pseudomarimonas arenosa]MBD8524170.1 ATP-binding cassette domain-containing protein [Pseudomarimonas arenosa]